VRRAAAAIDAVTEAVGALAALAVLALVAVMSANVLLRYGFATGSVWAQELEWHLLVPISLLGMVWALKRGEHVRVDVLYAAYGPRLRAWSDLIAALLGLVVLAAMAWLSLAYVGQSWRIGEGSANPGGIPWRWALKAFIPVGCGLMALQYLAETLRAAARLIRAA
jgi:TRAP-type mannitol/chloroaromatic compound transport system permease small subunit